MAGRRGARNLIRTKPLKSIIFALHFGAAPHCGTVKTSITHENERN